MPLSIQQKIRRLAPDELAGAVHAIAPAAAGPGMRRRAWEIVHEARPGDVASRRFQLFILALIALNVAAVVLESVRSIEASFGAAFAVLETFSVLVFLGEYALRLWSCVEDPHFRGPVRGRLRYARRPLALVDLLVILPFIATVARRTCACFARCGCSGSFGCSRPAGT